MALSLSIKYFAGEFLKGIQKIEQMLDEPTNVTDLFCGKYVSGKVAVDDEIGPVGYIAWSKECPVDREVLRLVVHPEHRRQSIATALIDAVEYKMAPCEAVSLSCPAHCPDVSRTFIANKYEMSGTYKHNGIQYFRFLKWII